MESAQNVLASLEPELVKKILENSRLESISKETEILREQQFVKVIPVVVEGLVKVYSRFDGKELLLYYIEPAQSCVMSFYSALKHTPSRVYAETEQDSKILLIPVQFLPNWVQDYPAFNELFYTQYNMRYTELLDTISHLLLDKMDKRLYDHLVRKIELSESNSLKISHGQLANELGTAREVVSRVIKKLELENKVIQHAGIISLVPEQ